MKFNRTSPRDPVELQMTPMIDVVFQLLIFFMLSSNLTPYSLLTLQSAPGASDDAQAAAGSETTTDTSTESAPADVALWTIEGGRVSVGGQSFDFEALPDLAAALGTPSAPAEVVLLVSNEAQVQDVATVLEALQAANVAAVRVATEEG